ncbi:MAG: carbohydrate kinase family protein [Spirochaetaceae bacterium]|jgi:sugar/nucleoside kinase (ribokinase family)|nr:carbohydrate kinase family protein [Spirochaetaceae bacterium]
MDSLYRADFSGSVFQAALSRREGDGGLTPGRLVFAENFERFMGKPYEEALGSLIEGKGSDSQNLGGPSVVSLAHVAQVRPGDEVCFFGVRGNDETGGLVEKALARLPFKKYHLSIRDGATPRTDVLSDPRYDNGHGERTFISLLGTASRFGPPDLGASFFEADIIALGGTALVPALHDGLTELLKQAQGAVTVVNLVYDFRSEYAAPGKKWRLGIRDDAYPYIDVLIADRDEVLKTSGRDSPEEAAAWLLSRGVGAVVITEGARPVRLAAGKGLFAPRELTAMPVCEIINQELSLPRKSPGDTTGCGDNFAGGIIAGIAEQLGALPRGSLDLREACIPAVVAGGFACFTVGGTYYESYPGEKQKKIEPYIRAYGKHLGGIL